MKTACLILAAATVSTLAFANGSDAVTSAANNTSEIPAIVAELKTPKAAFAGDVLAAIASMPKSPAAKADKMIAAAKALLPLADENKLADMVVAIIANTPFEALPVLVGETQPTAQTEVVGLDDKSYDALLSSVVKKIGALKDFSNDDKTIISAFALKLLARGEDNNAIIESVAKVAKSMPAAYGKQVIEAFPAVLKGDYQSVLGDTKIITLPKFDKPVVESNVPTAEDVAVPHGAKAKAVRPVDTVIPPAPKPPVPPVYAEQF